MSVTGILRRTDGWMNRIMLDFQKGFDTAPCRTLMIKLDTQAGGWGSIDKLKKCERAEVSKGG